MPYREFVDSREIRWSVWQVAANRSERRQRATRWSEERVKSDRRRRSEPHARMRISAPLCAGWLCFESTSEKRRLVPVPPGWQRMSDRGLEELCSRATATLKTVRQYIDVRRPRSGFGLPAARDDRLKRRALLERRPR